MNVIKYIIIASLLSSTGMIAAAQEPADSLAKYLEEAALNNPQVQSDFMLYQASLEKVPQVGAYPDLQLSMGFFFKPMATLMGKQVANFTLMQMFPWFGTRKNARSRATEMSRMAYEKFRENRDNLWYKVKKQWYQLSNLNEESKTTQANIELLYQLEELALQRFSAPSVQGGSPAASISSGMKSGGMKSKNPTSGKMSGMGGRSMGAKSGGMSDVLRIQMERMELEDKLENLNSAMKIAKAQFNALLNRSSEAPIMIPDSLEQRVFQIDGETSLDHILTNNPMVLMAEAEADAYHAKAKTDLRMSYPMFGIGFQYSLLNKMDHPIGMPKMNGKDMVMPMVKLSLPIFRRKYNAQQRESQNNWKASELKRDNIENQLEVEYINICEQLNNADRKIDLYTRLYSLSFSTWKLVMQEFAAGQQSLTDVIEVERQLLDYKLKKSEAIAAYNTGVAAIEKLISTSLNQDEDEKNN